MTEVELSRFPFQVPVDPDKATKEIHFDPDQGLFASEGIANSFRRIDETYSQDRLARLRFMASNVIQLDSPRLNIAAAVDVDDDPDEANLWMSPINDGTHQSGPEALYEVILKDKPTKSDIARVQPNSWGPMTKFDISYSFNQKEGIGMPMMQVFAPEAQAFSAMDRLKILSGDMTPYGKLAVASLNEGARLKHERFGTSGFKRVNLFVAGMGAKALGAAVYIQQELPDVEVGAVTLMNFSMSEGKQSALAASAKTAVNYARRRTTGEAAEILFPHGYVRVAEPLMRREIESIGTEFAMRKRQAREALRPHLWVPVMHPRKGVEYIETLLEGGATITIANALNEPIVADTARYTPNGDAQFNRVDIVGVEGKKVGMMANEHASLVALVNGIGLKFHRDRLQSNPDV